MIAFLASIKPSAELSLIYTYILLHSINQFCQLLIFAILITTFASKFARCSIIAYNALHSHTTPAFYYHSNPLYVFPSHLPIHHSYNQHAHFVPQIPPPVISTLYPKGPLKLFLHFLDSILRGHTLE